VKPGIREEDVLISIWEACPDSDRRQNVFREMLRRGFRSMMETGDMPQALVEQCQLDRFVQPRRARAQADRPADAPGYPLAQGFPVPPGYPAQPPYQVYAPYAAQPPAFQPQPYAAPPGWREPEPQWQRRAEPGWDAPSDRPASPEEPPPAPPHAPAPDRIASPRPPVEPSPPPARAADPPPRETRDSDRPGEPPADVRRKIGKLM
jgi:hypothetical protein